MAAGGIESFACPSTSTCFATGFNGAVITTADGGTTWTDTASPPAGTWPSIIGIACPTTTTCVATADGSYGAADVISTTDGGASWSSQTLPGRTAYLHGIACPSASTCYTSGYDDANDGLILSWNSPGAPTGPSIITSSLVGGTVGSIYSATLAATGGTVPYTWSIPLGSLPAGLSLDASTGSITGTPTTSGTTDFTVEATDAEAPTMSTTAALSIGVAPAQTSTMTSVEPTESLFGQSVVFSATVTGVGASPSGSVAFNTGTTFLCTATLSGGTGSCAAANAPAAADTVTATYLGDAANAASSASTSLDVSMFAASTGVSTDVVSSVVGQTVIYSSTVSSPGGTPTGIVTISTGTITLCVVTLSFGTGSCQASRAPVGTDLITATYSWNPTFSSAIGTSSLTVARAATSVALTSTNNPTTVGQTVTYTATVGATPPGSGLPTGTMAFTGNGTTIGICSTVVVAGGRATCTTTYPITGPAGPIVATYSGDANFTGSASPGLAEQVRAVPVVAASVSSRAVGRGTSVTYSASVSGPAGVPAGSVTFSIGTITLCAAALSGGSASCTTTSAPVGDDQTVIAAYGGSPTYAAATGTTELSVEPLAPPPAPVVTPDGKGYWLVASDGGIFGFGDAGFLGSTGGSTLNKPIVGMAATPDGKGYWLVASDGGIFGFGDAGFLGSTGGQHPQQAHRGYGRRPRTARATGWWRPTAASSASVTPASSAPPAEAPSTSPLWAWPPTPDGKGYWLVASDGGIFAFGDAGFFGSTGGSTLNKPIVGMAATPDGKGYWLVASDGGIFGFGDAGFFGSTGGTHPQQAHRGYGRHPGRQGLLVGGERRRHLRLR